MAPAIASIGGVLATLLTAVVGYLALKAKRVSDKGASDVESVKVSLTSLQAALARADIERAALGLELTGTEAEISTLRLDLAKTKAELRDAKARIRELAKQIDALGGHVTEEATVDHA